MATREEGSLIGLIFNGSLHCCIRLLVRFFVVDGLKEVYALVLHFFCVDQLRHVRLLLDWRVWF